MAHCQSRRVDATVFMLQSEISVRPIIVPRCLTRILFPSPSPSVSLTRASCGKERKKLARCILSYIFSSNFISKHIFPSHRKRRPEILNTSVKKPNTGRNPMQAVHGEEIMMYSRVGLAAGHLLNSINFHHTLRTGGDEGRICDHLTPVHDLHIAFLEGLVHTASYNEIIPRSSTLKLATGFFSPGYPLSLIYSSQIRHQRTISASILIYKEYQLCRQDLPPSSRPVPVPANCSRRICELLSPILS